MCTWHSGSSIFVVPSIFDFSRDSLLETLDAMIDRQAQRLASGEPLRASDKDPLAPELQLWMDGSYLRHPLVYAVPYSEQMAPYYNRRLRIMRIQTEKALAAGDWGSYIWQHERPYRLSALIKVIDRLSDEEYWPMIGQFWTDSENIHQNSQTWRTLWSSRRPGREAVMDDEEREVLASLPDIVPIYRGFRHTKSLRGMAWTLDRDKAVWFARRLASSKTPQPRVANAMVARHKILAYFAGRNEQEIVVLSRDLQNITSEIISLKKGFDE
jgi:hypothetical protein